MAASFRLYEPARAPGARYAGVPMTFTKRLHAGIRAGKITCSVRIWQRPHVKVGGRYALPPGQIVVTSLVEMSLGDVTSSLARRSGFVGLVDLLKTAKHGPGRRVFLVEFRYEKPRRKRGATARRGAL